MFHASRSAFGLGCCVLLLHLGGTTARGGGPRPAAVKVRLSSGRGVDYRFDYDRNALRQTLRIDGGFLAATPSGGLLRIESPSMRLVKERLLDQPVTALGHGRDGEPLAGFGDGRICRVDPVSLVLAEMFKLSAEPRRIVWAGAVGDRPAGLVAVVKTKEIAQDHAFGGSAVHDLATGKEYPVESAVSAWHVDRSGRLWIGRDHGEWGGGVVRIDLATGTTTELPPPPSPDPKRKPYWRGIYGFIEPRDGQVWAYGGISHVGFNHGFVARVDEPAPRLLFTFDFPDQPFDPEHPDREQKPDPDRPWMPLTHMVEQGDHLLVFSCDDVFRVDRTLKDWKQAASLDLQYRWGRPDAVGAYPSVNRVLRSRLRGWSATAPGGSGSAPSAASG